MFLRYLRRELTNRRKQTAIIAVGMALAIALVVIVSSFSSAVKDAQATALESVYGVGTDITVTKTPAATTPAAGGAGGRPNFTFGGQDPAAAGGSTTLSQSRLTIGRGSQSMPSTTLDTVIAASGVSNATGILQLQSTDFSGTVTQTPTSGTTTTTGPPTGGGGGGRFGGGDFSVSQTTVEGIPVSGELVGPITNTAAVDGRTFEASDAGTNVAVLDQTYATSESKAVGGTIALGGKDFAIVGIVGATGSSSTTTSNVYIPLDTAQAMYLATLTADEQADPANAKLITTIYVSASSSSKVDSIQSALASALAGTTVSTEADLASTISGSLSTASNLISNLGKWLSIAVLAAAFLLAILFTISGVTRRTREFGTLKAMGWSNGRITRQVAGESVVQGLIGGVLGAAIGLIGIAVVNVIAPTISGTVAAARTAGAAPSAPTGAQGGPPGGAEGGGGAFGGTRAAASTTTDAVLHAPVLVQILILAVGLAVLGGLLAGAFGGWRASRLRPAEALRSVA
ncbi:MAG: hypothetical protein JWN61_710 [Pseudonocardiales bacterium]|nr:hypothetical protein [Pseudonocardiales bacterium]